MGCLEVIILACLGIALISLFFFAIEIAVLAIIGAVVLGGLGFLIFGFGGLKVGVVLGAIIGAVWAFCN